MSLKKLNKKLEVWDKEKSLPCPFCDGDVVLKCEYREFSHEQETAADMIISENVEINKGHIVRCREDYIVEHGDDTEEIESTSEPELIPEPEIKKVEEKKKEEPETVEDVRAIIKATAIPKENLLNLMAMKKDAIHKVSENYLQQNTWLAEQIREQYAVWIGDMDSRHGKLAFLWCFEMARMIIDEWAINEKDENTKEEIIRFF